MTQHRNSHISIQFSSSNNIIIIASILYSLEIWPEGPCIHGLRRPRLGQWTNASFRSHVQSIIPKSAHRVARSTTTRRHCRLIDTACSGSHTYKLWIKKNRLPCRHRNKRARFRGRLGCIYGSIPRTYMATATTPGTYIHP